MKKVLIINSEVPWGGLGQYSINLAAGLKDEGFEVFGLVTHSDAGRYAEFAAETSGASFLGRFGKLRRYFEIAREVRRLKPDFLILNNNAPAQMLLPLLPGCRSVSVVHSDDDRFYRIALINRRHVSAWVAPSQRIKDGLIGYAGGKGVEDRIRVIPHGVPPGSDIAADRDDDVFNIAFIGYLHDYKGVDLLPDIFVRFRKASGGIKSHLTVIGGGDRAEVLQTRFSDLGLSRAVTMTGVISQEEVRAYLGKMDALLFPTWLESFGLVIVEAMMEGVVPVVTLLPGVTDGIIENGSSGFLVEKNDIDGFVSSLLLLCRNGGLKHSMAKTCRDVANERFSLEKMSRNYGSLLMGLR